VSSAAEHVWSEIAVRSRSVAFLADLLGKIEHDRHWEQVMLLGELDQWPSRLTLHVRGVDDRERGCARRRPAMNRSTANASVVALWSFSSSATNPRQKSDEMTSVAAKCWRANELLLEPVRPISTSRLGSGSSILTG
jgi:hypothetical protein